MTDIALIWNPAQGYADFAVAGGDLAADQGLYTAVTVSLFTDAQAQPGDVIPDGSSDPRGWWGDMPIDPAAQDATAPPRRIGSRLWLLDRALQTPETLARAQSYAREALQWLLDDGVAGSVTAAASFPALGWIELDIYLGQSGGSPAFTFTWANS
jgi:phage gp46-like protein